MESVDRGCGVSSVEFNSETDKCEDYMRFGEENHHCVCDTNYCNGANHTKAAVSVSLMLFALIFR